LPALSFFWSFDIPMRAAPTITTYNPSENADWALYLAWKAEGHTASAAATPITNG
jgi:hypothetical protein